MRQFGRHIPNLRKSAPWVLAVVFATAGSLLFYKSFAATYATGAEAESAQLSGAATVEDSATASGGQVVHFGATNDPRLGARINFGAFTVGPGGNYRDWTPSDITALETKLGHKVSPIQYFTDFSPFRLADCKTLAASGHTMLVAWQPNVTTASIINGNSDTYIKQFAADVAKCPTQVAIRIYPEMNGSFATYSPYHDRDYPADPDSTHTTSVVQLVTAYKHMIDVFRTVNTTNAKWVFCPNETDDPTDATNRMEDYYPGDAYTDILAFDAYNWGNGGPFSYWRGPYDVHKTVYDRVGAINTKMPIWVTETSSKEPLENDGYGTDPNDSKGTWIRDLFNEKGLPRISTLVWFDINKQTNPPQSGERDWRVDSSTDSLNALKQSLTMTP